MLKLAAQRIDLTIPAPIYSECPECKTRLTKIGEEPNRDIVRYDGQFFHLSKGCFVKWFNKRKPYLRTRTYSGI